MAPDTQTARRQTGWRAGGLMGLALAALAGGAAAVAAGTVGAVAAAAAGGVEMNGSSAVSAPWWVAVPERGEGERLVGGHLSRQGEVLGAAPSLPAAPHVMAASGKRPAAVTRPHPLLAARALVGTPFIDVAAILADPPTLLDAAFPLLAVDAGVVAPPGTAAQDWAPIYGLTSLAGRVWLVGVRRVRRSQGAVTVTLRVVPPGWEGAANKSSTAGQHAHATAAAARAVMNGRGATPLHLTARRVLQGTGASSYRWRPAGVAPGGPDPATRLRVRAVPRAGAGGAADAHFLHTTVEGVATALGRHFGRADCRRRYRSLDGGCNSVTRGDMGGAATPMRRLPAHDPVYGDGEAAPAGRGRPSARAISNALVPPGGAPPPPSRRRLNDLMWVFAQSLDHDLSHSGAPSTGPYAEAMPIPIPVEDPVFVGGAALRFFRTYRVRRPRWPVQPAGAGGRTGRTRRRRRRGRVGWAAATPGGVPNELTAWVDASHVYGGDRVRAAALRAGAGGRLAASGAGGQYLPLNGGGSGGVGVHLDAASLTTPPGSQVVAGDVRAGENVLLTAIHTVWVRAHNRWAAAIAAGMPNGTTDEAIYQLARQAVGAAQAKITYEEFLPALLGPAATPCRKGAYNRSVDARIDVFFSTVAFRIGHTLVSDSLARRDAAGRPLPPLPLAATFFRSPAFLDSPAAGVDALLRGAAAQVAGEVDVFIVPALRNLLFGGAGRVGTDLLALNIQRGRDHGVPSYNDARDAYGLPRATAWAHITPDGAVAARLAAAYGGDLGAVDAFVGGLAEAHTPGGSVGPLFAAAIHDQFSRLAVGDRFFYTRTATPFPRRLVAAVPELGRLGKSGKWGLADLLTATTGVTAASLPRKGIFFADPPSP